MEATRHGTTTAMFTLLARLDGPVIGGILCIVCLLLAVHFVTAADAGTQVLCMLNSLGSIDPPNWLRVMWCVLEGAIAASLIVAGGLVAIQMASIVVGLPIALYMLVTSYSLARSLRAQAGSVTLGTPPRVTVEPVWVAAAVVTGRQTLHGHWLHSERRANKKGDPCGSPFSSIW